MFPGWEQNIPTLGMFSRPVVCRIRQESKRQAFIVKQVPLIDKQVTLVAQNQFRFIDTR